MSSAYPCWHSRALCKSLRHPKSSSKFHKQHPTLLGSILPLYLTACLNCQSTLMFLLHNLINTTTLKNAAFYFFIPPTICLYSHLLEYCTWLLPASMLNNIQHHSKGTVKALILCHCTAHCIPMQTAYWSPKIRRHICSIEHLKNESD